MHPIHHTEGFILDSRGFGEANKYFFIFTKDFGLLCAAAQGIRKVNSKLKFSLQDFSHVRIDLVRGKSIWRITNAEKISAPFPFGSPALPTIVSIFSLIKRMCHGEEKNKELYAVLCELASVVEANNLSEDDLKNLECATVSKVLQSLGYLPSGSSASFLCASPLSLQSIEDARKSRREIVAVINEALKSTHL